MANELRLRRGTTAEHATFTGKDSEVTVDTTKDTIVVHDGITVGGHPLAKEAAVATKAEADGSNATGTWAIDISGNANTATAANFASNAGNVSDGIITTAKIATEAVTEAKIADGAVTLAKLLSSIYGTSGANKLVQFDGAGKIDASVIANLVGGFSNMQVFTSSGTFTVPAGVTKVKVTVQAGGGGGRGGGASGTTGGTGGTSSFGSLISATGGPGGPTSAGGSGAGQLNINGGVPGGGAGAGGGYAQGVYTVTPSSSISVTVGTGGGGGSPSGTNAGQGGTTGDGFLSVENNSSVGKVGTLYGGGGNGGGNNAQGGFAGAAGIVIVEY